MRDLHDALTRIMVAVADRWDVPADVLRQLGQEDQVRALGISMGLGALYQDDVASERAWMKTANGLLAGQCPLTVLLSGDGHTVVQLVNRIRGLP